MFPRWLSAAHVFAIMLLIAGGVFIWMSKQETMMVSPVFTPDDLAVSQGARVRPPVRYTLSTGDKMAYMIFGGCLAAVGTFILISAIKKTAISRKEEQEDNQHM